MSGLLKKFDTFNKIKLGFPSISAIELKMRWLCSPASFLLFFFPKLHKQNCCYWAQSLPIAQLCSQFCQPKLVATCGVTLGLHCEQSLALGFSSLIPSFWPNTEQQKFLQTLCGLSWRKRNILTMLIFEAVLIQARTSPSQNHGMVWVWRDLP